MSKINGQTNKRASLMRRVLVWFLVFLMVAGMVVPSLAWLLSINTSAAYNIGYTDEKLVRIGLLYGDSVVSAFQTRTPYGFKVCAVNKETDEVTELYTLSIKTVETAIEKNLTIVNNDYVEVEGKCDIGAYHAMLDASLTLDELYLAMHTAVVNGVDAPMIASYSDGAYRLFVGSFESAEKAQNYIDSFPGAFAGLKIRGESREKMTVYTPSDSAVILINPENNMTVFEFDGKETEEIAIMALDSPDGEKAYLQTPANKLYDGLFIFTRYKSGVQLVNLIGLEDYVKGVLPYEISNSWPLETQKAFAVSVRSYTVNKLGRHSKAYGFDLCNTVCCQSYGGMRNVNDTVVRAVEETHGQVLADNDGNIITTYYSAVAGGTTVSGKDAWGGIDSGYLQAIDTPWEDYSGHPNGTWTVSMSPSELSDILVSKGYTDIKSPIAEIETVCAENSDYVHTIIFRDQSENSVTIKNTDTVRSKLSSFLRSANFKVGKGSVTVNDPAFDSDAAKVLFSKINGNKISYIKWTDPIKVLSSRGEEYTWAGVNTPVITGSGKIGYADRTVTVNADSPTDFIFVGRGWGHGVGLSQVGAYNLGLQGFSAEFILTAYFAGTHIVNIYE